MESLAISWIYELKTDMYKLNAIYSKRYEGWQQSVRFAIQYKEFEINRRRTSQLCYAVGGKVVELFEKNFPDAIDSMFAEEEENKARE